MLKVYLAGKTQGINTKEQAGWRAAAKELMKEYAEVIDPDTLDIKDYRTIVACNKLQISNSHVILAEIDSKETSIDTVGEIMFAYHFHLPVVAWGKQRNHPWIMNHSTATFEKLVEATEFIREAILPSYGGDGWW